MWHLIKSYTNKIRLLPVENWEYSVIDAIRGFITVTKIKKKNEFINLPGLGKSIPTRSGRAAIVEAIKAIDLPEGARIGVPLYNCPAVLKAIKRAKCVPIFIDVDSDNFCMSSKDLYSKRSNIDAVIAVHMFGNICDMPKILEAADGKPVIEDCAQSIGSTLNGQMVGSFGIISAFSFRSGKLLSVGEGGALFTKSNDIYSRVINSMNFLTKPPKKEEILHIAKTYCRTKLRTKPLFGIVGQSVWKIYNDNVAFKSKTPVIVGHIYETDLNTITHRLQKLDNVIRKNRSNANRYLKALKLEPYMFCHERLGSKYNRYLYPIKFNSKRNRDEIANCLSRKNIGTIKPYEDSVEIGTAHFGYNGDCPVTEIISKRVLLIPNHYNLAQKDVQLIINCLNESWEEIMSRDHVDNL